MSLFALGVNRIRSRVLPGRPEAVPYGPKLLVLIDDLLLVLAGFQIGVADEQGNLVVFVQVLPQLGGEGVDIRGNGDPLRLALEGGNHGIAVADVGVQEVSQTGGGGIFVEEPGAVRSLGVGGFQNMSACSSLVMGAGS